MNLKNDALWLIMDPWLEQPEEDKKLCQNIDEINSDMAKKIAAHLRNVTHVRITMDEQKEVHPLLKHYINIGYNVEVLNKYMRDNYLSNIVYCGFHYGICIINRPTGARAMSQHYQAWVKKSLCGIFPKKQHLIVSDKKFMIYADKLTRQYARII